MTIQNIQNLASELQQMKDEKAFVLKKYQEKIDSLETNLRSFLTAKFNQDTLSKQNYILNRPYKWGALTSLKVSPVLSSQIFDNNGKFIPYYNGIHLFDFHQTLDFINKHQELELVFLKDPAFNEFFNSNNHFIVLTAPDYEREEYEGTNSSYIYEYMIISIEADFFQNS